MLSVHLILSMTNVIHEKAYIHPHMHMHMNNINVCTPEARTMAPVGSRSQANL